MSISTSLKSWLDANSAISAIVSTRNFASIIPANFTDRPCVTFSLENAQDYEIWEGRSDTKEAEFSIEAWAPDYVTANSLSDTIRTEIVGFRGAFGAHTAESILLLNQFDAPKDDDTGLFRVSLRIQIAYI